MFRRTGNADYVFLTDVGDQLLYDGGAELAAGGGYGDGRVAVRIYHTVMLLKSGEVVVGPNTDRLREYHGITAVV